MIEKGGPMVMTNMTPRAVRLRLCELRTQRGLTQAKLADLAGLHQLTISRLEGDPRQVEFETLEKLCAALGVSLSELIVNDRES